MAVKLGDIARSVLAAVASDAGLELAGRWLNERYVEFCARTRLHQLRSVGQVYVPAPLTAGTVNATLGSNQVVGTSTAFTNAHVNCFFRYSVVWYRIIAVNATTQTLTLDSLVGEDTNTAATYFVVHRYIPLDANTRWVGEVIHQRRRRKLVNMPWHRFQTTYPSRQLVGAYPWAYTEAPHNDGVNPTDPTRRKYIEVYPPSSIEEVYTYTSWAIPDKLELEDYLPPEVDGYVLREGGLIDHYRYQAEMAIQGGKVDVAGYYANMAARQMTIWEDKIQQSILADSAGRQDVSLEWAAYGLATDGSDMDTDIVNAHQDIIWSWTM